MVRSPGFESESSKSCSLGLSTVRAGRCPWAIDQLSRLGLMLEPVTLTLRRLAAPALTLISQAEATKLSLDDAQRRAGYVWSRGPGSPTIGATVLAKDYLAAHVCDAKSPTKSTAFFSRLMRLSFRRSHGAPPLDMYTLRGNVLRKMYCRPRSDIPA